MCVCVCVFALTTGLIAIISDLEVTEREKGETEKERKKERVSKEESRDSKSLVRLLKDTSVHLKESRQILTRITKNPCH